MVCDSVTGLHFSSCDKCDSEDTSVTCVTGLRVTGVTVRRNEDRVCRKSSLKLRFDQRKLTFDSISLKNFGRARARGATRCCDFRDMRTVTLPRAPMR